MYEQSVNILKGKKLKNYHVSSSLSLYLVKLIT